MSFGTDYITKPLREKIEKLQEENKQLRKLVQSDEALEKNLMKEKLEAIRGVAEKALEEYSSINGAYWERTEALEKILALIGSAQNTDYVQKEETKNE